MLRIARKIMDTVRPTRTDSNRMLGFSIGPVAMDQGEDDVRSVIRGAFDVALATDMSVALHLDDFMFWAQARWPDGRLLRATRGTAEWKDWSQTPAGGLQIGWLPNIKLAPQLCFESPVVKDFVAYWTRDVIGKEVNKQLDRLAQAGKAKLFAGVIVGWESNLAHGYCSLSQLGYSAQNPPADFERERERVLQRHAERWAKAIYDAGIPKRPNLHPSGTYAKTRLRENGCNAAALAATGDSLFNRYSDGFQRLLESRLQRLSGRRAFQEYP